jgi:hypothetical protein
MIGRTQGRVVIGPMFEECDGHSVSRLAGHYLLILPNFLRQHRHRLMRTVMRHINGRHTYDILSS